MNLISIYSNYNIILLDPLIYSSVNSIFYCQGKKKVLVPCGVHEDEVRIIFFKKLPSTKLRNVIVLNAFISNVILFASFHNSVFFFSLKTAYWIEIF